MRSMSTWGFHVSHLGLGDKLGDAADAPPKELLRCWLDRRKMAGGCGSREKGYGSGNNSSKLRYGPTWGPHIEMRVSETLEQNS